MITFACQCPEPCETHLSLETNPVYSDRDGLAAKIVLRDLEEKNHEIFLNYEQIHELACQLNTLSRKMRMSLAGTRAGIAPQHSARLAKETKGGERG